MGNNKNCGYCYNRGCRECEPAIRAAEIIAASAAPPKIAAGASTEGQCCKRCLFSAVDPAWSAAGERLLCRRYPPKLIVRQTLGAESQGSRFVSVAEDDWCGEYREAYPHGSR